MTTSHIDRKEIKRPDSFVQQTTSVFQYINENSRTFLAILAALLLVGVGIAFYSSNRSQKAEQANSALYSAKKALLDARAKPEAKSAWDKTVKPELEKVEKVAQEYKGTRAAYEAHLLVGDSYTANNNPQAAIEHFKRALDSASSRTDKAFAQHALAYAYENTKQHDQAIDALRQVINFGEKAIKGDALLALARNYELKGDKVRALEHYDQVIREYSNTELARAAEIQKSYLK